MADAAPLDHPAVISLLALTPTLPEEFSAAVKLIGREFYDGADLLAGETVLSVGRRQTSCGGEEITVVTRTDDGRLRVHGCQPDGDTPAYGSNVYDDASTMIRMQDSVLSPGETWCGDYEHELFGQLAI